MIDIKLLGVITCKGWIIMRKTKKNKRWLDRIPHPLALLFYIVIIAAILTYIIPAGSYDRETVDDTTRTIPGSFEYTDSSPVGIMDIFTSIPEGFQEMSDIVFITFAAAMMFGLLEKTGMLENTVGTLIRKVGINRRIIIVVLITFIYGFFGMFIGLENNIALIPIAVLLSTAIGGDALLGAG